MLLLEPGLGIGRGAGAQQPLQPRLAGERVVIGHDLGVGGDPTAVRHDEQRIDLDQQRFALEKQRRQLSRCLRQRRGLGSRHAPDQPLDAGNDRGSVGSHRFRAQILRRNGLDLHASLLRDDHPHAARCGVYHQGDIDLGDSGDLSFDAHGLDPLALEQGAEHRLAAARHLVHRRRLPDQSRLASAARGDLPLDHPRPLGQRGQIQGASLLQQRAGRHIHRRRLEQPLGVMFQEIHSIRLHARDFDNPAPFPGLGPHELAELFRRGSRRHRPLGPELFDDFFLIQRLDELVM